MNNRKRRSLVAKGWKIGSTSEFLNLSPEEEAYVELKLKLSKGLQEYRKEKKFTQEALARLIKSSQSRVAKMESGDPSVSLDLLIRSLLTLGASRKNLSQMFS
jgi:DNA-binding XRE family transcriptional regulator